MKDLSLKQLREEQEKYYNLFEDEMPCICFEVD
jgi:hypothetical protein